MPPQPSTDLPDHIDTIRRMSASEWQAILNGDAARARQWIRAAARMGHSEAQVVLGQWLLDGHGGDSDPPMALQWFLKAASQGHAMGSNMAGRCYENAWGTAAQPDRAVAMYEKAAGLGLDAGMYNLANQLAAGHGIAQDHHRALTLYSQAARLGHVKSLTKAANYLEDGTVVEKNLAMAFSFYQLAAEGGDFRGQFGHARLLAGEGRHDEALQWLRKVSETATPAYLAETGRLLQASPLAAYREVGASMLALAAQTEPHRLAAGTTQ